MASIAGFSSRPRLDRLYSTLGGEVGSTVRMTTPSASSFFSRALRTLAEMLGMSAFNSLKRRGCWLRYQMILGVQWPPMMLRHSLKGQRGWATGLRRLGSMFNSLASWLPDGYR